MIGDQVQVKARISLCEHVEAQDPAKIGELPEIAFSVERGQGESSGKA